VGAAVTAGPVVPNVRGLSDDGLPLALEVLIRARTLVLAEQPVDAGDVLDEAFGFATVCIGQLAEWVAVEMRRRVEVTVAGEVADLGDDARRFVEDVSRGRYDDR